MPILPLLFPLVFTACDKDSTPDTGPAGDTGAPVPAPAALAELSSGECPDLSVSGEITSFNSGGIEREVAIFFPEDRPADMPVMFFFHGLVDTTYDPVDYFSTALGLQGRADAAGVVIIAPKSRTMTVYGMEFYMWEVMNLDDLDLTLYDDLRTCVANELATDVTHLTAMGFSGGALFTTVLARDRGDTLAAITEFSGGSDAESSLFEDTVSAYGTPPYTMPAMLSSGGEYDVWPDPSFYIVNFVETTDSLQAALLADGHFVMRCRHDNGHSLSLSQFADGQTWLLSHQYGYSSPYLDSGIGEFDDWCEVAEPVPE